MIPYTSRSLARKLQTSFIGQLPSLDQTPLLSFLYPRCYATSNNAVEHDAISKDPHNSSLQPFRAADLFSSPVDPPRDHILKPSSLDPPDRKSGLHNVVQERVQRLPRSKLKTTSALEKDLLNRISATPTFKTARGDVEALFNANSDDAVARHTAYRARVKSIYRSHSIDWVPIARKLLQMKGTPKGHAEATLDLSEDFVEEYIGSCMHNMWIVRVGSGAQIHLLPASETGQGSRKVLLYGSSHSVDLAVQTLRRQQDYFAISGELEPETIKSPGLEMITSVASFSSYVRSLISRRKPRQVQQETGKTRDESIAAALLQVFLDPASSRFANTDALRAALNWTCRHDELQESAVSLFAQAKQLGLRPDTATFNFLIEQAIRSRKVSRTISLLDDMHSMGISVNGHTWALFLTAGPSPVSVSIKYRLAIISLMREAQVHLNKSARREIVRWMIVDEFIKMEDSKEAFFETLSYFDHLFGTTWFDSTSYRTIVHTVKRRTKILKILPGLLLDLPEQRGLPSNRNVEMLKLYIHRRRKDVHTAIEDLSTMLRRNDGKQLEFPVAYVFMAAWDKAYMNVCRVLWRYAASHGSILDTMQRCVYSSLVYNNSSRPDWHVANWRRKAGSVIAGTDLDMAGFTDTFPRLSQFCSHFANPMAWLTVYTPDDGTRDEQIALAYVMLNRDLKAWKRYQPMANIQLVSLLETAKQQDMDWKKAMLLNKSPASELIERAISVPLHARESVPQVDRINSITGVSVTDAVVIRTKSPMPDFVVNGNEADQQQLVKR